MAKKICINENCSFGNYISNECSLGSDSNCRALYSKDFKICKEYIPEEDKYLEVELIWNSDKFWFSSNKDIASSGDRFVGYKFK